MKSWLFSFSIFVVIYLFFQIYKINICVLCRFKGELMHYLYAPAKVAFWGLFLYNNPERSPHINTKIDLPNKCTESLKSYLHQKDLNHHIKAVHDPVKYTCTRCLRNYTRIYNLATHLAKDCIAKVGSVPIVRIQTVPEYLRDFTIPSISNTLQIPRYMHAQAASASPTTRTTNLPSVATLSQELGSGSPHRPRIKTPIRKLVGKSLLDLTPKSLDPKLTRRANTADMPDPSELWAPVEPVLAPTNPPPTLTIGSSPTVPTWHPYEDYLHLPVFLDLMDINTQIQQSDPLNLAADLELSDSSPDRDSTDKEEEHVLNLHRAARMSPGERAHTSINLLDWHLRLPASPAVESTTERTPPH